jgi:antitoxin (DNA-binding transcriptional repressor) of toxin-antitoxin stability system
MGPCWPVRPPQVPSHACYSGGVAEPITQRELRNDSGEIMRRLDQGEAFIVTRNGVAVGELLPLRRRRFVAAETVVASFRSAPPIDSAQFRADVDAYVKQDIDPRA